jgi:ubiquinone/menaquinone biosynthesis C-methylase UbiE
MDGRPSLSSLAALSAFNNFEMTRGYDMSFYSDHVLPHVINLSMRNRELRPYRERVIAHAQGRVLEVGVGSGVNLPFYGTRVREIVGLEPSARLTVMAQRAAGQSRAPVTLIEGSAEMIQLESASVDTVVSTWTLCSIQDAARGLAEMRRVLKPTGQLLFVEHGLAPEENVRRWQHRLTPIWKRIGGGCHLDRPICVLIESAGFNIRQLETGYMKGPKPLTFMFEGRAMPL